MAQQRKAYRFAPQRPIIVRAPAPAPAPLARFGAARRSVSGAINRWKAKAQAKAVSARRGLARVKEEAYGAAGMLSAAGGGATVALAEEYLMQDIFGVPVSVPMAGATYIAGRRYNSSAMVHAAHGMAGVAGYQLTTDYIINGLLAEE